jgi:hypothetical protein
VDLFAIERVVAKDMQLHLYLVYYFAKAAIVVVVLKNNVVQGFVAIL